MAHREGNQEGTWELLSLTLYIPLPCQVEVNDPRNLAAALQISDKPRIVNTATGRGPSRPINGGPWLPSWQAAIPNSRGHLLQQHGLPTRRKCAAI